MAGEIVVELNESHVREHYVHSLMQILSTSILFWDHIITLDAEVKYIWLRPKSRSSIMFLAIRYFALASNISVLISSFCRFNAKR
ncbi:hypothetical protein VNI00_003855 [Paramarasmius palmivorus]|uniref:DUF6533 domain-containing protein n=1 Tax=Paramarasmius palmivorus TaxID=297713 RepID=A0AAW0DQ78_9AGAR